MSVEREMSLAEWCAKLPSQHLVNQELAELTKQLAALAEQTEKLRDALGWHPGNYKLNDEDRKHINEALSLPALAYQNEKMREALRLARFDSLNMTLAGWEKLKEAAVLPDLATPVLNRIKAEAYREAAEIAGPEDSYQDQWFKAKSDSCAKLRAKADELEKNK